MAKHLPKDVHKKWDSLFLAPFPYGKRCKSIQKYMDVWSTMMFGKFSLDIVKLDDDLKALWAKEYTDDMSMDDFITFKYGNEASNLITKIIS